MRGLFEASCAADCGRMCAAVVLIAGIVGPVAAAADAGGSEHHRYAYIVYFNPADRDCIPGYQERVDRVVTNVQDFYRTEMARNGYGPLTFPVERDEDGKLVIHVVKGTRSYAVGEEITSDHVRDEQVKPALAKLGIDIDNEHIIIFQNLSFIEEDNVIKASYAYCGTGGDQGHRLGTAWVGEHPLVDPLNYNLSEPEIVDGGRKMPAYDYITRQIGGVAHEFGHALGLPHNQEMPDELEALGTALMGSGNYRFHYELTPKGGKGAFLSKTHAAILALHPLFKGDAKDVDIEPKCTFEDLKFDCDGKTTYVSGRVQTNLKPVLAVVYNDLMFHRVDYDSTSWTAPVAADGSFKVRVGDVRKGPFELRLKCFLENGAHQTLTFRYEMDDSFEFPSASLERQYLYERFVAPAHRELDAKGVALGVEKLAGTDDHWYRKAKAVYEVLTREPAPLRDLASVGEDVKEIQLSSVQWDSATVGWSTPGVDCVPGEKAPFESTEGVYTRGIYAHADSSYVYNVDGKWKTFESKFALQNWGPGSVVFVVKCDGEERFRSDIMDKWNEGRVAVDLTGVKKLELIVEDGGNGKWADDGNWLEPILKR